MSHSNSLHLAQIKSGDHVVLLDFNAGKGLINRLNSLGMTPGADIRVVQNIGRGPLIVSVRGARIALGRGEAEQLVVEHYLS